MGPSDGVGVGGDVGGTVGADVVETGAGVAAVTSGQSMAGSWDMAAHKSMNMSS